MIGGTYALFIETKPRASFGNRAGDVFVLFWRFSFEIVSAWKPMLQQHVFYLYL
jgi:hypothetical protein